jgi:hypothetical protein
MKCSVASRIPASEWRMSGAAAATTASSFGMMLAVAVFIRSRRLASASATVAPYQRRARLDVSPGSGWRPRLRWDRIAAGCVRWIYERKLASFVLSE